MNGEVKRMSRLHHALGWLRSMLFTDLLIYLYTIVLGTISLAGSLFDPRGRFQHRCAQVWSRMILATSRISVKLVGWENIEPGRAYIFCANHLSLIDTPVVFSLPMEFRILAKKGLFQIPFLGWHLRRSGHLPVARDSPRAALRSFEQAARKIREGTSLFFFPEGGRSEDGRLQPFKTGPFLLAIKAGVPVVPMALRGTREILPIGSMYIRAGRVEVEVARPISTEGMTLKDVDRLAAEVREQVARCLPWESSEAVRRQQSAVSATKAEG